MSLMPLSPHRGLNLSPWVIRPVLLTALGILSACSVAPVQPPLTSVPLTSAFAHDASAVTATQAFDGDWWAGYGDVTLTALVEEALAANHDVAIALQRVAQARAGRDA